MAVVRVGVGIRHAHQDRERAAGRRRAARPPLVRVDHVVVAVALDAALDVGGVGARDPRLGHREARPDLAVEQRDRATPPAAAACRTRRAAPCCRCRARSSSWPPRERRLAHELAQRRVLDVRQARAEVASGRKRFHRPALVRLGLELLHDRRVEVRVARLAHLLAVDGLGRIDPLADEVAQPLLELAACARLARTPSRPTLPVDQQAHFV